VTYIDAHYSRDNNLVRVVERVDGKRVYNEYPAPYVFYYADNKGTHTSIYGDKLTQFKCNDYKTFQKNLALMRGRKIFESDINPLFRVLEENYHNAEMPKLHIGMFDIEVDFDPNIGYASPEDAYAPINAISVHHSWTDKLHTYVVKPKTLSDDEAQAICNKFSDTVLCDSERDLLKNFLNIIEDVDILSGWNSSFFDIPYITERINVVLGKDYTRKLCLWDARPLKRTVEQYGREQTTYDLIGRVHLDYLELYKKHSQQEMHSYRLEYVGEFEVGEKKTAYEGSLDKLYKQDFEKFIEYNRQDVLLIVKIDQKSKNRYIDLASAVAHTNCVLLKTTMGTVTLVDQAILLEAHSRNLIVPDKKESGSHSSVAGAFVADPKVGIHEYVGCIDINSLYPSAIRALNMCPETIIGQIHTDKTEAHLKAKIASGVSEADAWHGVFGTVEYNMVINKTDDMLVLEFEDGNKEELTAAQIYELVFESQQPWVLSANGTIFRTDVDGIIPVTLAKWYSDRKSMQKEKKKYDGLAKDETDPVKKKEYEGSAQYWDQRQFARKILLNSLYGATLNPTFRFYDNRLGQSVTLTGRIITKHMSATVNELIAGKYDYSGEAIIYNDTDSVVGSTIQRTNWGDISIEKLFERCPNKWTTSLTSGKEYASSYELRVLSYDPVTDKPYFGEINYIYRHKVSKEQWEIEDELGNKIRVTGDHSVMVERDGILLEAKPRDILPKDTLLSVTSTINRGIVKSIVQLANFDNEYVYDIGMKNTQHPWFFGNNILVHNSVYFSATPVIKNNEAFSDFDLTKDNIVKLYDAVTEQVNESFPTFMKAACNCPTTHGEIIQAGRELVGSMGLFIKKKRYAIMKYDEEGKRLDVDGKPGKIKAMGLDTKRTDTPKPIQAFLQSILEKILCGATEQDVLDFIKTFRETFKKWNSWEKGTPKGVNGLYKYEEKLKNDKAATLPGHVRASINWNKLRKMNNDNFSMEIKDGTKVVVCKLKDNNMRMTSVAYPVDEQHLPQWFKELPFNDAEMEEGILDQKLENLIGVLSWNLKSTKETTNFNLLFKPKSKK
jgi:DNA polymerase elongation subunit (family B)